MDMLPTLDAEVFCELQEGVAQKPGAMAALYGTFFSNAARLIGAFAAADPAVTREKTLHALKGSAGMMGAARMARLAADLQEASATMSDHTVRSAVAQLQLELELVRRDVDSLLRGGMR
jgi:HPt (histidine-containing phosphotransfer) domain-containing protein